MHQNDLPHNYTPSDDEEFMNENQQIFFKQQLENWREKLLQEFSQTINQLQNSSVPESDIIDIASNELDHAIELRARDRGRKLINKIEQALKRIEKGDYGYCEETGDPIGVKRLKARPIATLCIEAQEKHERRERTYKSD